MALQKSKVSRVTGEGRCSYVALLSVGWVYHMYRIFLFMQYNLKQSWVKYGSEAICGPLRFLIRPAKLEQIILIAVISFIFSVL